MDTIGTNDQIGLRRSSIGKGYPGDFAVLLEGAATMSAMQHACGQRFCKHVDEVGAVHSKCRIPARGVRHLDWRNGRSVMAEIAGIGADTRPPFFHRWLQSDPLQMPHTVGRQKHAGADLTNSRSLLVKRNLYTFRPHRIGCKQSANSASHDRDIKTGLHHSTPYDETLKSPAAPLYPHIQQGILPSHRQALEKREGSLCPLRTPGRSGHKLPSRFSRA